MKLRSAIPSTFRRSIKEAFTTNLSTKIFSLACAIALYVFVHGAQDAQRVVAAALVVLLPPASQNKILTTDLPTSVRIVLHGPRSIVENLQSSDLTIQLDLRSGTTGTVALEPHMLRIPGSVTIDAIDPSAINIVWDDVIERRLQLQVAITGAPADGLVVNGTPTASPDSLMARGPGQVVNSLHVARAEAFDISGLAEGIHSQTLAIERPIPRVSYSITHATASVQIIRKLQDRLFSNIPVQVVGLPKATILPSNVDVRVSGTPEAVADLRVEQIVPRVSIDDTDAAKRSASIALPVKLQLENLEVKLIPDSVVVRW